MASMAIAFQLKPKPSIRNPSFLHFFSSSTSTPDLTPNDNPSSSPSQSQSLPSVSSVFSDVKANLKNKPSPPEQSLTPSSTEDLKKRLSQFRPNASPPPSSSQPVSFQGLYQKNMLRQGGPATTNTGETRGSNPFDAIRESLKNLRSNINPGTKSPNSLSQLREGMNLRPRESNSPVIGGSGILPASIFGREMNDTEGEFPEMKTQYMKSYERDELGMKLRELRPKNLKEFSMKELNERLVKLREIDDTETTTKGGVVNMKDLRNSLMKITIDKDKEKKTTARRLDILGQLGQTPSFMLSPPKEHLVEKYFHPDNMSSAEKLKIELLKVRDEFKISETDCGSAQVQVAQLTTKIKHLDDILHKKDKHSRKGMLEMIQRRKKLLKYLRRTDWDSYTMLLSKLGLRDNPNYKAK